MYLTSQLVRSPAGDEGINAYLNLHREQPLPFLGPEEPDLGYVAQYSGGYPVAESESLRPGGNAVCAYLDFAAPDSVSEAALRSAAATLEQRIQPRGIPLTVSTGGVSARFGVILEMEQDMQRLHSILRDLTTEALALLQRRHPQSAQTLLRSDPEAPQSFRARHGP